MTKTKDGDRAALRPPRSDGTAGEGRWDGESGSSGELFRSPGSPIGRWHTRTFEFATSEAALLYTACAVALAMMGGVWPVVELHRRRVRLRLGTALEPTPLERAAWAELAEWARRLGGNEVTAPVAPTEQPGC